MKRTLPAVLIGLLVLAAGSVLYARRVHVSDWVQERRAEELPMEVGYRDIAGGAAPDDEPTRASEPAETGAREEGRETVAATGSGGGTTGGTTAEPSGGTPDAATAEERADAALPAEFNLAVPFTSQAPFSNWDEVHEETCEEASIYMVHSFYEGLSGVIDAQTAEDELQRIVAKETELFGYYKDTTAAETARLAKELYGYAHAEVVPNPTVEQIKEFLVAGHPVIVPAAGRELGNPYFTPPGPPYHMFVIRGYTDRGFIANDPGTRRGAGYVYPYDTLMSAIHDWNAENIDLGAKVILVIYP